MDLLLERMRRAFRADDQSEEQPGRFFGAVIRILAAAAAYYLATRIAWALTFPDSKVSLFFPPHAVLVCVLLLVAPRHWWAYVLAAAASHFIATQQAHWPPLYALQCEAFDAVKYVATAAGIRLFVTSPFHRISLRDAVLFVAIAVVIVPAGTAFWGAAFTLSYGYGTRYWVEWRNLAVSNGVTAIVLVPAIMVGVDWLILFVGEKTQGDARVPVEEAAADPLVIAIDDVDDAAGGNAVGGLLHHFLEDPRMRRTPLDFEFDLRER